MKGRTFLEIIIALLVILFMYAGSSKFYDMHAFRAGMKNQPFPVWINKVLATTLPFLEIIIALALGFTKSRRIALYAYFFLMLAFTLYTGMVVFNFFKNSPCGCGGIINHLSWTWHFIINLIFLILTVIAILLNKRSEIFMHKQEVSPKPVTE